jgi:serine/threonine protein kinase
MAAIVSCPDSEVLQRLLLGCVDDQEALALEEHLASCPVCQGILPGLDAKDALVQSLHGGQTVLAELSGGAAVEKLLRQLGNVAPPVLKTVSDAADLPHDTPSESELGNPRDLLAPPQAPGELGRLGPYQVLKVLGSGGMGVVFEALDPQLQRRVALKVIKDTLPGGVEARQRFLREARATAALEHDHIVSIYQVGEDRGVLYLAMPLLEGETLEARLQREGMLDLAEVLRIGRETADGLAAAHALGLVHRDIKPNNLFLATERPATAALSTLPPPPKVKILDFGLALSRTSAAITQGGMILGTPAYMAPEQGRGERVDHRADLFSLGCVLYGLSTGEAPFQGNDSVSTLVAVATQHPRPPRQINPNLPEAFSDLVMQLLAKNPSDRPQSAAAVAQELPRIADREAGHLRPYMETTQAPLPASRRGSWWRGIAIAAGTAALAVVLAGFWWWRDRSPDGGGHGTSVNIPEGTVAKLQVLALQVRHFAQIKGQFRDPRGVLGEQSFASPRLGDSVEVEARLSRPGYAYLISFRPDGQEELCWPGKDSDPPPLTDRPCYPLPEKQEVDYGLDDGEGLQVFAVVASSQLLPAYRAWRQECGSSAWQKAKAAPGVVWRYDGAGLTALTAADPAGLRGRDHKVPEKVPLVRLVDWLRQSPQAEAVGAVGFAVVPQGKP